jgi:hypothetical protein
MDRERSETGLYTNVYSDEFISHIRSLFKEGKSIPKIASETGCSKSHVWRLCKDIKRPRATIEIKETGIRNDYIINEDGTVSIKITHKGTEMFTIISESDFLEKVKDFSTKWYAQYSKNNNSYYAMCRNVNSPHIQLHRFILFPPDDMLVDHINHDTLDNRRDNLRIVTHSQNQLNRKKPGAGVYWYKPYGKWRVRCRVDKKEVHVGYFDNKEDAERAYKERKEALDR